MNSSDALQPRFVIGGSHVDSGQIRRCTFDSMRHCASQFPPSVRSLHYQRTATVALEDNSSIKYQLFDNNYISNTYFTRVALSVGVTGT